MPPTPGPLPCLNPPGANRATQGTAKALTPPTQRAPLGARWGQNPNPPGPGEITPRGGVPSPKKLFPPKKSLGGEKPGTPLGSPKIRAHTLPSGKSQFWFVFPFSPYPKPPQGNPRFSQRACSFLGSQTQPKTPRGPQGFSRAERGPKRAQFCAARKFSPPGFPNKSPAKPPLELSQANWRKVNNPWSPPTDLGPCLPGALGLILRVWYQCPSTVPNEEASSSAGSNSAAGETAYQTTAMGAVTGLTGLRSTVSPRASRASA